MLDLTFPNMGKKINKQVYTTTHCMHMTKYKAVLCLPSEKLGDLRYSIDTSWCRKIRTTEKEYHISWIKNLAYTQTCALTTHTLYKYRYEMLF